MTHSFFISGSGRFSHDLMVAAQGTVFIKSGAEGVYISCLPALGLGIAVKSEDGTKRAAKTTMAAILQLLMPQMGTVPTIVNENAHRSLRNRANIEFGEMSLSVESAAALARELRGA
jgi:L-asparaginase II